MRSRRKSRLQHGLSFPEEMQLVHGHTCSIFAPRINPFESEEAEHRCWDQHRNELLPKFIDAHPGSRPSAYLRFDLRIPTSELPRRWFNSIDMLLDRNLISPDEAARCESNITAFNPSESMHDYCLSFEDAEQVQTMQLGRSTLRDVLATLELATRWHTWRSRPELGELFRTRAHKLRQILESETQGVSK